ncbi:orotate phosphoribosyltransferase [Candidatus Methylomirabilis lanthanidiphila]|uniref:Orotate phosphoribosyltransferase n=1 Tax=Candidatus Methylomirabilis lanthanidiphila TaxID=2211376 RepID=A0A564ZLX9_9BACT|nr:orotate phosphoribosyltransferase [Candidatus Methylomirabilis lanthanidiphila]
MDTPRDQLLKLLVQHSFQHSAEPVFTLASGRKSRYYINCKATTFMAEAMPLLGRLFFERIKTREQKDGEQIAAVGGLTLGADPIAYAVAYHSALHGTPIQAFSVRKEPKGHGAQKWVEGFEQPGARVVIIEDVVTTGASTLKAIDGALHAGFQIVTVLALVDRQEGGREELQRKGHEIEAIYTTEDLMRVVRRQGD